MPSLYTEDERLARYSRLRKRRDAIEKILGIAIANDIRRLVSAEKILFNALLNAFTVNFKVIDNGNIQVHILHLVKAKFPDIDIIS